MVGPGQESRSLHFSSRTLRCYSSFYGITISSEIHEIYYHVVSEISEIIVPRAHSYHQLGVLFPQQRRSETPTKVGRSRRECHRLTSRERQKDWGAGRELQGISWPGPFSARIKCTARCHRSRWEHASIPAFNGTFGEIPSWGGHTMNSKSGYLENWSALGRFPMLTL